jgi:hypothetical protein
MDLVVIEEIETQVSYDVLPELPAVLFVGH